MAGLAIRAARRAAQRVRTFHRRRLYPWIPWWAEIRTESDVHPHAAAERGDAFEAHDTASTEFEVLNWLNASVRALKPSAVLETGSAEGLGTIALASACAANGSGVVHTVEVDPALCARVERRLRSAGLSAYARVHCLPSLEFLAATAERFEIGFFDSLCESRVEEFRLCLDRGLLTRIGVFHDTSPTRCETLRHSPAPEVHARYREALQALERDERCCGSMESTLSRGFVAIFVKPTRSAAA